MALFVLTNNKFWLEKRPVTNDPSHSFAYLKEMIRRGSCHRAGQCVTSISTWPTTTPCESFVQNKSTRTLVDVQSILPACTRILRWYIYWSSTIRFSSRCRIPLPVEQNNRLSQQKTHRYGIYWWYHEERYADNSRVHLVSVHAEDRSSDETFLMFSSIVRTWWKVIFWSDSGALVSVCRKSNIRIEITFYQMKKRLQSSHVFRHAKLRDIGYH